MVISDKPVTSSLMRIVRKRCNQFATETAIFSETLCCLAPEYGYHFIFLWQRKYFSPLAVNRFLKPVKKFQNVRAGIYANLRVVNILCGSLWFKKMLRGRFSENKFLLQNVSRLIIIVKKNSSPRLVYSASSGSVHLWPRHTKHLCIFWNFKLWDHWNRWMTCHSRRPDFTWRRNRPLSQNHKNHWQTY